MCYNEDQLNCVYCAYNNLDVSNIYCRNCDGENFFIHKTNEYSDLILMLVVKILYEKGYGEE
jgi:hypothetical protein